MKIQLKDLQPNPFRDIDNYPINQAKVEGLVNSIEQTGFWDNILARKADGVFELAYGLHRFIALEQLFNPDHEIDIPVKELDDATMVRIMAHENDDCWGSTPKIIDETIRVARKFLEEHPEIVKELRLKKTTSSVEEVGTIIISRFLGDNWNETKVGHSLKRLKLIKDEKLDKEAVESLSTDNAARTFTAAVKSESIGPVTPTQQRRAAKRIVESGNYSKSGIEKALLDAKHPSRKKKKPDEKLIELNDYVAETIKVMDSLNRRIETINRLKEKAGTKLCVRSLELAELENQIRTLMSNLQTLCGGKIEPDKKRIQSGLE